MANAKFVMKQPKAPDGTTAERRPMNGEEMRAVEYLTAMNSKMNQAGDCMRDRLRSVPNGWRQWRLLAVTLDRLLLAIYDSMTTKNLRHLENICDHGEIIIRLRPAVRVPEHTLVSEDDLRTLVNAAMASECAICLKQGREIDRCSLRTAMLNICPPYEDPKTSCGYQIVASSSKLGEYI